MQFAHEVYEVSLQVCALAAVTQRIDKRLANQVTIRTFYW